MFVEKCDAVDIGEVGIFVVNGDVYIKELGSKCLISYNKSTSLFALVRTIAFTAAVGLLELYKHQKR